MWCGLIVLAFPWHLDWTRPTNGVQFHLRVIADIKQHDSGPAEKRPLCVHLPPPAGGVATARPSFLLAFFEKHWWTHWWLYISFTTWVRCLENQLGDLGWMLSQIPGRKAAHVLRYLAFDDPP